MQCCCIHHLRFCVHTSPPRVNTHITLSMQMQLFLLITLAPQKCTPSINRYSHLIIYRYHAVVCSFPSLPLSLLSIQEALQNSQSSLQRCKPNPQRLINLRLILSQLNIEVFSIRTSTHGRAENGLYHEAMVRFQCIRICVSERDGEFFGVGGYVFG